MCSGWVPEIVPLGEIKGDMVTMAVILIVEQARLSFVLPRSSWVTAMMRVNYYAACCI